MSGDPAVFVDKDGTLVENEPYNVDPQRIRLTPGAVEGVRALAAAGYRVVVISNQPGAALGYFPEEKLADVERALQTMVARLDGFYYCPHHPEASCDCRKPEPGLIFRAARELGIDLERSWMVGDILDDVEAGRRAGCRTCLIDNGNETEWKTGAFRNPDCIACDLREAANMILAS